MCQYTMNCSISDEKATGYIGIAKCYTVKLCDG